MPTLGDRAYEHALVELAEADPDLVVMTAENRAMLRGAQGRLGSRFIDTGITEQTLIGSATGLALGGRPVVVHALAAFLTMRAFEFIRTDVGISSLPVKLVGFVPGLLSDGNGPTHQAIEDIGLMRQIPGMRIFAPTDIADLVAALPVVVGDPQPWYIRYPMAGGGVPSTALRLGESRTLRDGTDATILTYGYMVRHSLAAAEQLAVGGIEAAVVDMRTLAPVDVGTIVAALASPLCVTVEDHRRIGALASLTAEIGLAARITGRHLPIDLGDRWFAPGLIDQVLENERLSADAIAKAIEASLKNTSQQGEG